jgi:hypothetical protein
MVMFIGNNASIDSDESNDNGVTTDRVDHPVVDNRGDDGEEVDDDETEERLEQLEQPQITPTGESVLQ